MLYTKNQVNQIIAREIGINPDRMGKALENFIAESTSFKVSIDKNEQEQFTRIQLRNSLTNQRFEVTRDFRGRVNARAITPKLAPTAAQVHALSEKIAASSKRASSSLR